MADKTLVVALLAAAGIGIYYMAQTKPTLRALTPGDLVRGGRDWSGNMDRKLILLLDVFFAAIEQAGGRAYISPHPDSLGRTSGAADSDHYAGDDGMKTIYAADVMIEGMTIQQAYTIARGYPFTAFGVYTDTTPHHMLHLSTRTSRTAANPALWSRVGGEYGALLAAFV